MTTLIQTENFKIDFNGRTSYFVIDETGNCLKRVDTLRKAKNFLNKVLVDSNC